MARLRAWHTRLRVWHTRLRVWHMVWAHRVWPRHPHAWHTALAHRVWTARLRVWHRALAHLHALHRAWVPPLRQRHAAYRAWSHPVSQRACALSLLLLPGPCRAVVMPGCLPPQYAAALACRPAFPHRCASCHRAPRAVPAPCVPAYQRISSARVRAGPAMAHPRSAAFPAPVPAPASPRTCCPPPWRSAQMSGLPGPGLPRCHPLQYRPHHRFSATATAPRPGLTAPRSAHTRPIRQIPPVRAVQMPPPVPPCPVALPVQTALRATAARMPQPPTMAKTAPAAPRPLARHHPLASAMSDVPTTANPRVPALRLHPVPCPIRPPPWPPATAAAPCGIPQAPRSAPIPP